MNIGTSVGLVVEANPFRKERTRRREGADRRFQEATYRASRHIRLTTWSRPRGMSGISKSQVRRLAEGARRSTPSSNGSRGLLALPEYRRHLPEGPPGLADRLGDRHLRPSPSMRNADGRREAEPNWTEFTRKLTPRGLSGVRPRKAEAVVSKVQCSTSHRGAISREMVPPMPARAAPGLSQPSLPPLSPFAQDPALRINRCLQ